MKKILTVSFALLLSGPVFCQDPQPYNHYYLYPFLYNPSYMGGKQSTEVNLLYRQQWIGMDGAPNFSNFSMIVPLSSRMATGVSLMSNKRGLINSVSAQTALSYSVYFERDKYLNFGLSAGVGRNSLDTRQVDLSDPVIARAARNSFYLEGQAGANLQLDNLNIGFSMPILFNQSLADPNSFQKVKLTPFSTTISSLSYKMDVGYSGVQLQPLLIYQTSAVYKNEFQGALTLFVKDVIWLGGLYKQSGTADIHTGFRIDNHFSLGYSYEFPVQKSTLSYNTQEFRLAMQFGKLKQKSKGNSLSTRKVKKKSGHRPRYEK